MTAATGHLKPTGLCFTSRNWPGGRNKATSGSLAPELAPLLKLCCSFLALKGGKNKAAVTRCQKVEWTPGWGCCQQSYKCHRCVQIIDCFCYFIWISRLGKSRLKSNSLKRSQLYLLFVSDNWMCVTICMDFSIDRGCNSLYNSI